VIVVAPKLKVCVPTLFIPVTADDATVAPVIAHVNLVTEQLSAVVGLVVTTDFVHDPAVTVVAMFAGHVIVGKTLSVTVTVCVADAVLLEPSVTVQVTVVFPIGYDVGALFVTEVTEQLSAVVGVPKATPVAVHAVLVVAFAAAGAVIVGKILSVIVTMNEHVAELPAASKTE
jgi:hypothetical protein